MVNPVNKLKLAIAVIGVLLSSTFVSNLATIENSSEVIEESENNFAPCPSGSIGGSVFIDFDTDGTDDGNSENAFSNIKVQIFSVDGGGDSELIETVMTDGNGDYEFSSPSITFGSGENYRVEFSDIPSPYSLSINGPDNKTETRYISVSDCDVNLGIMEAEVYCQEDASLAISCFVEGPNTGSEDVLISIPVDVTPAGNENADIGLVKHESDAQKIGTTYGLAYSKQAGSLFASAFMKRFTGYGPDGPGAIYIIDNPSDNNLSGSLFIDINDLFASPVAGTDSHDFTLFGSDYRDSNAFDKVGREAFGDLDITNDGLNLWAVNLNDRSLYNIPLGSDPENPIAPTNSSEVTVIPLADAMNPLPGIPAGVQNEELIPFALKIRRNVLYVGLICNGQSSGPLRALVYSYDLDSPAFVKELEVDLTYRRGCGFGGGSTCYGPADWQGWTNTNVFPSPTVSGFGELGYPQPILADIEFDRDGNMLLGLRDRWGDQGGYNSPEPSSPFDLKISDAFGDLLLAEFNGSGWTIDENNFVDNTNSYGSGEVYFSDDDYISGGYYHEETAMGGLAVHYGAQQLIVCSMDPRSNAFSNGVDWFDLSTSGKDLDKALTVLTGATAQFGKAYGLGEVELICEEAPIQIGNLVWVDANGNGIQEADELPVPNLSVKLYSNPSNGSNPELLASTMTDANGEYYFTNENTAGQNWEVGYDRVEKGLNYYVVFCGDSYDPMTGSITVGSTQYSITQKDMGDGMSDNPDFNDSDVENITIQSVGDMPAIAITANETNNTFDMGVFECTLTAGISDPGDICVDGGSLNFTGTGMPAGGTGYFTTTALSGLTDNGNGTASLDASMAGVGDWAVSYIYQDALGCSASATVTVTVNGPPSININGGMAYEDLCVNQGTVNLSALPVGGTWSGTGIVNGATGAFDPAVAGVGMHDITYTLTDLNGCTDFGMTTISVNNLTPDVSLNNSAICSDPVYGSNAIDLVDLIQAGPTTGTWSDTDNTMSLSGSVFTANPGHAGNSYTFTYTIDGEGPVATGCGQRSFTVEVEVEAILDASFTAGLNSGVFCLDEAPVDFSAAIAGGLFAGTGITDNNAGTFDPSVAGVGKHSISYSVVGANGCVYTDDQEVTVNAVTEQVELSNSSVCAEASYGVNSIDLQSLIVSGPTDGNWSDTDGSGGLTGSVFEANASHRGNTYTFSYTVDGEGPNGTSCADNSFDLEITVNDCRYDLALRKTVSPAGPYKYGDTLTYSIEVFNQLGQTVSNVEVADLIPCGLEFVETPNIGWAYDSGVARTTITEQIAEGESVTKDLKLVVQRCQTPGSLNYLNTAEITSFKDKDGNDPGAPDVDSTPDDNFANDVLEDDEIDNNNGDEDDHDVEDIEICDLALINKLAEPVGGVKIGQMVKMSVLIYNQGNVTSNGVLVDYTIPKGFKYLDQNNSLSPAWTKASESLAQIETNRVLQPGERDSICIYLEVANVSQDESSYDAWTTMAEITAIKDVQNALKYVDADSTPDSDPTNDSGGNPDDETDDVIDGKGTGDPEDEDEDKNPELDEDDHDPAKIEVCDIATIIYTNDTDIKRYGDIVQFKVDIVNQGNGDLSNILLSERYNGGFKFVDNTSNSTYGWYEVEAGRLNLLFDEVLTPGESRTLCLDMELVPTKDASEDTWTQIIEVERFESVDNPGVSKSDIDSTPDSDPENDSGGNTDDDTDNEVDGKGTGDPEDENEDRDPELDEDDHDPVKYKVYDLALYMQIDSMPPVLPVVPGDIMKFIVVVENQGNIDASQVELSNYVMSENLFLETQSKDLGWTEINDELHKYTINKTISPGGIDTTCIYLEVVAGAMSDIISWSEISDSYELQDDCYDIDSTPNDDPSDDIGGGVNSEEDDHIDDDGTDYNNDGIFDEDDHDPSMISVQDLALIVWADQKEPVKSGQDVKFRIRVSNQGNITNKEILLTNYIPQGFELSGADDNGWVDAGLNKVEKVLDGTLAMDEEVETCIILSVKEGVNASQLINYAEISSSKDLNDRVLDNLDIDSYYDSTLENDTGGEPSDPIDCDNNPTIIGDDNYVSGSGKNGEDEDDHDPAWVPVIDLASIIFTEHTQPLIPGDEIKFYVDLYNQGNMALKDIDLNIFMPEGFTLSENDDNGWLIQGDGNLEKTIGDAIHPNEKTQYCLVLTVEPDFTFTDLIPFVEIANMSDTLGNNRKLFDLDSDPDSNFGNDVGGIPLTETDDQIDGNGLLGSDEDDHDPVIPPVMDLAIKIVNNDLTPKFPGDLVKFDIIVYNQGSLTPSVFDITNYVPEGLVYNQIPENTGWVVVDGNPEYIYADVLLPLTSDTLCIYLSVDEDANPNNVVDMVEISRIIDAGGADVSDLDIDSVADSSNDNDKGNDLYSEEDDKIDENGRSGFDEDDHDQAFVLICQGMKCIGDVNLSLDENCYIRLTPAMFLEGDLFPDDFYTFTIKDEFGNSVVVEGFDLDDVGNTYSLTVYNNVCQNSCWLDVTVEYKLPPQLDCPDDLTISCGGFDVLGLPPAVASCGGLDFTVTLHNETRERLDCDPDYTHRIVRTYRATDEMGNFDECSHEILLERVDLSNIMFPENRTVAGGNPISCGDDTYIFDENGIPIPWLYSSITGSGSGFVGSGTSGVPFICDPSITDGVFCPLTGSGSGAPLIPMGGATDITFEGEVIVIPGEVNQVCNSVVLYTDIELPQVGCIRKVMRTWEVREWWCNGENTTGAVQLIEIVDDEAPEFVCPQDMTITTNDFCAAAVELPGITAFDECDGGIIVAIDYPKGYLNSNGGIVDLDVGINTISYIVSDSCYNSSSCSLNVTVRDDTEPVTICEQTTVVSISQNGQTLVYAESFDDGSWDECGLDGFAVRRMDTLCVAADTLFDESVSFCCADAGSEVMVVFRAYDLGGNYNECMVTVEVQDKDIPQLSCPSDVTIDCRDAYDLNNLGLVFGEADVDDNCAAQQVVQEIVTADVNQCGIGEIVRAFELRSQDSTILYRSCKQHITIVNYTPFVESNIQWPLNYDTTGVCRYDIGPDELPELYAYPQFLAGDDECSLLGWDYEDRIFETRDGLGECAYIERTWSVINWCSEINGSFEVFTIPQPQIIEIYNNVYPQIVAQGDTIIESFNIDCESGQFELTREGTDDCDSLYWSYEVRDDQDFLVAVGSSATYSDTLVNGDYTILWTVSDLCGNIATDEQALTVINKKTPIPICINGFSVSIEAVDNGNGIEYEAELWASDFDGGSYHPCGNPITLSMSSDTMVKNIVFDCEDVGIQPVQMWVTDRLTGEQDFCMTMVEVLDNPDCPVMMSLVDVTGDIYTEELEEISGVEVTLEGSEFEMMTEESGAYAFGDMPMGGDYAVVPNKDGDDLNGVSTLDIILIQRHILGIESLDSPYKLIAADIDNNQKVSASDLIELRKLILGVYESYPDNTSWRFVDALHDFTDVYDPWAQAFPEQYVIEKLSTDMAIDFVGVKVGDVNSNVDTSFGKSNSDQGDSSTKQLNFVYDTEFENNGIIVYHISALNYENIMGWQGTFEFGSNIKELSIISDALDISDENYSNLSIEDGVASISYNDFDAKTIKDNEILFSVIVVPFDRNGHDLNLEVVSDITKAEAYKRDGEVIGISMKESLGADIELISIQPNPWVESAEIMYRVSESMEVVWEFYNVNGQLLHSEKLLVQEGNNTLELMSDSFDSNGVIYGRMITREKTHDFKMILIK